MSGQLTYSFTPPRGLAGTLLDIANLKDIDSRVNGETEVDAMRFGMGAVQGDSPGTSVVVPTSASTLDEFEGIVMTGHTQQMTMTGEVHVYPAQTVGILRWGRAWARVADGIIPEYGEPLFLIITGAEAGLFTNDDGGGTNMALNGRFYGGLGTGSVAPVELYTPVVQ